MNMANGEACLIKQVPHITTFIVPLHVQRRVINKPIINFIPDPCFREYSSDNNLTFYNFGCFRCG